MLLLGLALVGLMVGWWETRLPAAPAPPPDPYQELTFKSLGGFPYEPGKSGPLPDRVTRFNGKKVEMTGFMVPVDMDEHGVASFVLVKDQMMCCYGVAPALNEWIFVSVLKRVPVSMDRPVSVFGTLDVGEDVEDGEVLSLYRLHADRVDVPQDVEPTPLAPGR